MRICISNVSGIIRRAVSPSVWPFRPYLSAGARRVSIMASATTLDDLNKYMVVAAATIDGMAGQGGFSTPARRSIRTVTYRV